MNKNVYSVYTLSLLTLCCLYMCSQSMMVSFPVYLFMDFALVMAIQKYLGRRKGSHNSISENENLRKTFFIFWNILLHMFCMQILPYCSAIVKHFKQFRWVEKRNYNLYLCHILNNYYLDDLQIAIMLKYASLPSSFCFISNGTKIYIF